MKCSYGAMNFSGLNGKKICSRLKINEDPKKVMCISASKDCIVYSTLEVVNNVSN